MFYLPMRKKYKVKIHSIQEPTFFNETQVWALYYGIWGNTETDGEWINWKILHDDWSNSFFEPPNSIPSLFFPALGLYSCHHQPTLKNHIKSLINVGVNTIVLTWASPQNLPFLDQTLKYFLHFTQKMRFKIAILIPEYTNRSILTLFQDISTYISAYSSEQSLLKVNNCPIIIIENSYHLLHSTNFSFNLSSNLYTNDNRLLNTDAYYFPQTEYQQLISKLKEINQNPFLLGTGSSKNEAFNALDDGFNGFVSFYPSDYFSSLADPNTWKFDVSDFKSRGFLYIPTVSPGFNMSAKSLQFSRLSRSRRGGIRYEQQWKKAIDSHPEAILINSFNNWHDGTSIEPISIDPNYPIDNNIWAGNDSNVFMTLTKKWADIYHHN